MCFEDVKLNYYYCSVAGDAYAYGRGVRKRSIGHATELYARGCDLGSVRGCYELAYYLKNGEGVLKDIYRARRLYERVCDLGAGEGCEELGDQAYWGEHGELKEVIEYYGKACELGAAGGCNKLGLIYLRGKARDGLIDRQIIEKDLAKAKFFFGEACDIEPPIGCDDYARLKP